MYNCNRRHKAYVRSSFSDFITIILPSEFEITVDRLEESRMKSTKEEVQATTVMGHMTRITRYEVDEDETQISSFPWTNPSSLLLSFLKKI